MVDATDDLPYKVDHEPGVEVGSVDDGRAVRETKAQQVEGIRAEAFGQRAIDAAILERGGAGIDAMDEHHRVAAPAHDIADVALAPREAPQLAVERAARR